MSRYIQVLFLKSCLKTVLDVSAVVEALVDVLVLDVDVLVDVLEVVSKVGGSIFSKINLFLGYAVFLAILCGCSSSSFAILLECLKTPGKKKNNLKKLSFYYTENRSHYDL